MADPAFPVGGHGPIRGCGHLMQMLFGENVCENERIGSHRGRRVPEIFVCRSANAIDGICCINLIGLLRTNVDLAQFLKNIKPK